MPHRQDLEEEAAVEVAFFSSPILQYLLCKLVVSRESGAEHDAGLVPHGLGKGPASSDFFARLRLSIGSDHGDACVA